MSEQVSPALLEGLEVPTDALVTGAFRVVFYLDADGTDEAVWTHDGQIVLGRLLGQFEVIKHRYIADALEDEDA
jgi:hypothetical protein